MSKEMKVHGNNNLVYIYDPSTERDVFHSDLLGMIENSYDAVCIADSDTRILLLNRAFEKIMGISIREIIGQRIRDHIKAGITDNSATVRVLETGQPATVTINTHVGRQVLSTGVPVYDSRGNINRVYCNLRDITELNRLREQYMASQKLASRYLLELETLRSSQASQTGLITRNTNMQRIIDLAFSMARVESNLLISGESGVGKDELAKLIHESGPRSDSGVLVKVNCAAIPEALMESEFFGYESGAFTGARSGGKPGYLEIADKGTLFLDEVGELPLSLQAKLLTVLQDRKVTRVGGAKPVAVDFRMIAATNRDLRAMVKAGKFREELFYRLNVVPIRIPPLRERSDDIPFLLAHFLDHYNTRYSLRVSLKEEALETLCRHPWPGNVRELMNLVERLVVTAQHSAIEIEHLPIQYKSAAPETFPHDAIPELAGAVRELEDALVRRAITLSNSREEAAARLGISLSSLSRRLRRARGGHS